MRVAGSRSSKDIMGFLPLFIVMLVLAGGLSIRANAAVYWVVETVAADHIGTTGSFADPYGIKAAADNAGAGDEVRIVKGSNDYDSTTSSWTNRDADKSVSFVFNGATWNNALTVSCWDDESTQNTDVGGCTLDFSSGTGDALKFIDYVVVENLKVINSTYSGFYNSNRVIYYRCEASVNSQYGFYCDGYTTVVQCRGHNNTKSGINLHGARSTIVASEFYANSESGIVTYSGSSGLSIVDTLCYSNTDYGINVPSYETSIYHVTANNNGSDGIRFSGTAGVLGFSFLTNNGGYGVRTTNGLSFLGYNNYYNNTSGAISGSSGEDLDSSSPDTDVVTYTSATDLMPTTTNSFELNVGHDTGGWWLKGAVQKKSTGGGEHSTVDVN